VERDPHFLGAHGIDVVIEFKHPVPFPTSLSIASASA